MNWFERYGIVGSYFIVLLYVILRFNLQRLGIAIEFSKGSMAVDAAIFVAASLALGYVISIFSQFLYYKGRNGLMIHGEIIKLCRQETGMDKYIQDEIKISENETEEDIEVKLTVFFRLKEKLLKRFQYLGVFSTKRWDVIAINSALILGTYLLFISCTILKIFIFIINNNLKTLWGWVDVFTLFIVVPILVLFHKSRNIISKQIIKIDFEKLKYIYEKDMASRNHEA